MTIEYDIHSLKRCLCCTNKFHYIIDVAKQLEHDDLIDLRNKLRCATAHNFLHSQLENQFNELIKNSKPRRTKKETTATTSTPSVDES
jgi:DNA-directed RNA polymerase beta subunit